MGDPRLVDDGARAVKELVAEFRRRLRDLEHPTGTERVQVVRKVAVAQTTADNAQTTATGAQTTATGALGVAQGASYDASQATAAAQTAQQTAAAAQSAAAAKIRWSTALPDDVATPGVTDGDQWVVTDGVGGPGKAQYRWSASSKKWILTPINGSMVQNIIADSITSGTFTGLVFKSAQTGKRFELLKQQMNIYGDDTSTMGVIGSSGNVTSLAFGIQDTAQGTTVSALFVARPFTVTDIRSWSAGNVTNAYASAGLRAPVLASRKVFIDRAGSSVVGSPSSTLVIDGGSTDDWLERPRINGGVYNVIPFDSTLSPVPVIYLDPNYADRPIVKASDFVLLDGTSIVQRDTGWLYPDLTNGWRNQSGTRLRYRVKGGIVYLQGYLSNAAATATVFATLPSNLTPSQNIRVPATNGTGSSGSWMDFPVGSNGNLASNTGNNPNFAVSWPTDQ